MLQIKNICKEYRTGSLIQKALDDVSLNLRDNEFVAILGPSGSGKTTLLNIIGGLDRYDSGDLIINGISTKKYKDRDWDSYRNHTIGFVFQSYNLIPHQTILSNVELALTISGIGKNERIQKAKKALAEVGLGNQLHKKPNQLSGGQMQRVAIARALVNDPDILLADEPTGALDSDTSVQVMELLKNVAKDRLVVMVTHNPELAKEYATRIVTLRDGKIRNDSMPLDINEESLSAPDHKNMGRSSMSFLTALALSFNNLRTKKARTLLTSFAGSIGIIGIALILSLSSGVNDYIQNVEEDTLSEYPLQIQSTGLDMTTMLLGDSESSNENSQEEDVHVVSMVTNMFSTMDANDLASLKKYFDSPESNIDDYTNAVEYSYNIVPQIYKEDGESIRQLHPDRSFESLGLGSSSNSNSFMSSMMSTNVFFEMPENVSLYENQYDVKAGRWPEKYNECVLVLTSNGSISDFLLYTLGLRDSVELDEMVRQFVNGENVNTPTDLSGYSYDDILGTTFKLVNSVDYYEYDSEYHIWKDKTDNEEYMKNLVNASEDLTIVGIVQPADGANASALSVGIGYMPSLTEYIAKNAQESEIVQAQLENPGIDVFTNEPFGSENENELEMDSLITVDEGAIEDAFVFDEDVLTEALSGSFDISDSFNASAANINLSDYIDLNNIHVELPDMPEISLGDLLSNVNVSVSADGLSRLASSLLEGYSGYAAQHPEADYSGLTEDFLTYLGTEDAWVILENNIREIIEANQEAAGIASITTEQLQSLVQEVMSGFGAYIVQNGYDDVETNFDNYLVEYLSTPEALAILEKWSSETFSGVENISITTQQLSKLATELAAGYQQYAVSSGLPDPSKMGDYFLDYLATEDGQQRLTAGISEAVDTQVLEEQISGVLESYIQSAANSYGNAMGDALEGQIISAMSQLMTQISGAMQNAMYNAMSQIGASLEDALSIDGEAFAGAFQMSMDSEELMELLLSMGSTDDASYDNNLRKLGYVDFDNPSQIDIYPKDFESKEKVVEILDAYNSRMEAEGKEEQVITYTDVVGTLMSSVTDIIDIISYVLIAFVAISLVVSSIMIGVITYISVLERKKEIGILRAIGASKSNVSQVFNAETFIIGLCAGLIGIIITLLLLIPGNMLIHHIAGSNDISASLPVVPGIILVVLSILLTILGGLIPSKKAAKSDPVTALRTE